LWGAQPRPASDDFGARPPSSGDEQASSQAKLRLFVVVKSPCGSRDKSVHSEAECRRSLEEGGRAPKGEPGLGESTGGWRPANPQKERAKPYSKPFRSGVALRPLR